MVKKQCEIRAAECILCNVANIFLATDRQLRRILTAINTTHFEVGEYSHFKNIFLTCLEDILTLRIPTIVLHESGRCSQNFRIFLKVVHTEDNILKLVAD